VKSRSYRQFLSAQSSTGFSLCARVSVTTMCSTRTCSTQCGSLRSHSCRSATATSFRTRTADELLPSAPVSWYETFLSLVCFLFDFVSLLLFCAESVVILRLLRTKQSEMHTDFIRQKPVVKQQWIKYNTWEVYLTKLWTLAVYQTISLHFWQLA